MPLKLLEAKESVYRFAVRTLLIQHLSLNLDSFWFLKIDGNFSLLISNGPWNVHVMKVKGFLNLFYQQLEKLLCVANKTSFLIPHLLSTFPAFPIFS